MGYKNLYNRIFFSLFFFFVYFIAISNKYLLLGIGTFIYLFIFYEVFKFFNKFYKFILCYLILSYCCFVYYFLILYDFIIFNVVVFTIILFDSLSFLTGKAFGKNYIFKFISPKKTLEGYLGGVIFTNIFFLFYSYFIHFEIKTISLIVIINLTILVAIYGDLIESYFKRKNNIKDSSKFLPGHGGYFDRFDSFIASIIMLTLFSLLKI